MRYDRCMSTLPRPTGKEHEKALERIGFVAERTRGSHCSSARGRPRDCRPASDTALGSGLLRKILSDCGIKPQQLTDLLLSWPAVSIHEGVNRIGSMAAATQFDALCRESSFPERVETLLRDG